MSLHEKYKDVHCEVRVFLIRLRGFLAQFYEPGAPGFLLTEASHVFPASP